MPAQPKNSADQHLISKAAGPKKHQGKYAETTLIEDVLEANKHVGEHIDSLTRRSTLIQERLLVLHPEVSLRVIRRILTKESDKAE
jgi:hypothetical protein